MAFWTGRPERAHDYGMVSGGTSIGGLRQQWVVGRTCNEALEGLSVLRAAIADLVRERTDA